MKILYTEPWDAERLNACVAVGFVSKWQLESSQPHICVYPSASLHYGGTFCIPVVIQRDSILKTEVLFECSTRSLEAEVLAAGGPKYQVGAATRAALAAIRAEREASRGSNS
jgi:hypothetical protein